MLSWAICTEKYVDGTGAPVRWPCATESHYLIPVPQPFIDTRFEYRAAIARAASLAVYYAYAALAGRCALGYEQMQLCSCLIAGQAMQIDVGLYGDSAPTEVTPAFRRKTRASKQQLFAGFDVCADQWVAQ